jgi:exodeoxyribonuclease III
MPAVKKQQTIKLITWNCNMAFRKKAPLVLAHKPDILVVPECEHPDNLIFEPGVKKPTDILWLGSNRHKGLGIFSYSDFTFSLLDNYNPALKLIAPVAVSGGRFDFTLFAIWANNPADPDGTYVEQVWKAIHLYKNELTRQPAVLMGDFNSNTIWDRKRRAGNHSNVVKVLEEKGIRSCYHLYYKQEQGKEKHPTQYMYRHRDKPYHLDYCFLSGDLMDQMKKVKIGDYDTWTKHSDHVPVMVTLRLD